MKRRAFMVGVGVGAAALLAFGAPPAAAQSGKARRIGFLEAGSRSANHAFLEAFRDGMTALGWNIGRDLEILDRWAEADGERLPALVAELLAAEVDLLVTAATPATLAARRATATVPIVSAGSSDLVKIGAVNSLARPGGNVTGVTALTIDAIPKALELGRETIPDARRWAVMFSRRDPDGRLRWEAAAAAADRLGLTLLPLDAATPEEVEAALGRLPELAVDGLLVIATPLTVAHRARIASAATAHRVPLVSTYRGFVAAGGLLSLGSNLPEVFRLAARLADRILRGVAPADLPVEQPSVEIFINLAAARTLGLTVPPAILARADEVIE
jgi:putative ABC transport system substrate-binding protein